MPKSLSASIVVDLYPTATVGLVALLQSQCDVAKFTPATRVEQIRFGGFNRISLNRVDVRVHEGVGIGQPRLRAHSRQLCHVVGARCRVRPFDEVSLGRGYMLGLAGLPRVMTRFYTVPDAVTARSNQVKISPIFSL